MAFGTGQRRTALLAVAPMRDGEGCVVGGGGAQVDVTAAKAVEWVLRDSEERRRSFNADLARMGAE